MTFYEDPNARDVNPYVREPERNRDAKTFEQEPLTVIDHIDANKHWIGESLPAPGAGELGLSGWLDVEGTSPFPARADHAHNQTDMWGIYVPFATQTVPPGQTFLNPFIPAAGKDMRAPASSQIFVPPIEGLWQYYLSLYIDRQGGGVFTGECNIVAFFNNGSSSRIIWRDTMANIPGSRVVDCWEVAELVTAPAAGINIQFAVQHNDVVNYFITVQYLLMTRGARSFSVA